MLQTVFNSLDGLGARLNRAVALLVGLVVIIMFSSLILQVISRYFFNAPLSWPEELTMFLMAWMSFLGASIALREWGHIGVDFFLEKLHGKTKLYLMLLVRCIVLCFTVFLFIEGTVFVVKSTKIVSDGMRISMVYPRLSMPVGGALMTLHTITFILSDILRLRATREASHG
jgi:TRAP-type C4-dicarboxylate transport system, small permease component